MTVIDDEVRAAVADVPPTMAERITLILDQFDGAGTRLTAEDLVQLTSIPRSTTHRILDQLTQLNWLRHNRTGYRLGWRAIALGRSNERDELRAAAAPHLHQLHLHTRMITHLSVLDGRDVVWLDKLGGRCADTIATRVGGRSRADLTSEGRAMLSLLPRNTSTCCTATSSRRSLFANYTDASASSAPATAARGRPTRKGCRR